MAYPIGATAEHALRTAHTASAHVQVFSSGLSFPGPGFLDIPLQDGDITMDGGSLIRTTASLKVDPSWWQWARLFPLYGSTMLVRYSIGSVDGVTPPVEVVFPPLICETATRETPGADITLTGSDPMRLCEYASFPFSVYTSSVLIANATYVDLLTWLLSPTFASANPSNLFYSNPPRVPAGYVLDASQERIQYIRDIASSLGVDVWMDRDGYWSAQPINRLQSVVWAIDAGSDGVMLTGQDILSGEKTRNSIAVFCEQSDGTPPIWVSAKDNDPASPTYVGGPFGERVYRRNSGFLRDIASMQALANQLLAEQSLLSRQSQFSIPPAPHLDPLDIVEVKFPGESGAIRQIETISHNLSGGPAKVGIREWINWAGSA
jgi:hypothetical protein